MNLSRHKPLAAWVPLTRRLSFMLLPALISEASARMVVPTSAPRPERSQPYLRVCLPPPLRFSPPPIPPEIADPTVVMGPASPGGPLEAIAAENKASAKSVEPNSTAPSPAPGATPKPADIQPVPTSASPDVSQPGVSSPAAATTAQAAPSATAPASPPPTIIPDDTPQAIHSEDLLPYFRLPASTPPPLPASSATYHQQ